mmetsp:Transcript_11378/g.23554  ORF Transcript_11378/g.23554 Transcript_11378/m.23554 type:complete len:258 (-) Transcript_11378:375-1148(-)
MHCFKHTFAFFTGSPAQGRSCQLCWLRHTLAHVVDLSPHGVNGRPHRSQLRHEVCVLLCQARDLLLHLRDLAVGHELGGLVRQRRGQLRTRAALLRALHLQLRRLVQQLAVAALQLLRRLPELGVVGLELGARRGRLPLEHRELLGRHGGGGLGREGGDELLQALVVGDLDLLPGHVPGELGDHALGDLLLEEGVGVGGLVLHQALHEELHEGRKAVLFQVVPRRHLLLLVHRLLVVGVGGLALRAPVGGGRRRFRT